LCGYKVPPGTTVYLPFFCIHRSENIWPEPLKFDPDRLWNENNFFGFSKPPRDCAGRNFSLMEMKYTLISLLSEFKFVPYIGPESEFYDGKTVKTGVAYAGLKPKGGVWVTAHFR